MKKIKIIGVSTSSRSRYSQDKLKDIVRNCKDRGELDYVIEKMSFRKSITNSEACLMASLFSVLEEGGEFDIIRLNKYFPKKYPANIPKDKKMTLLQILSAADGFIISTPVYFGSSSSYVESFLSFLNNNNLIRNKVIGLDSVGAKRNGGQETAIISTLHEASTLGAFVCGNGPKTSQYGGTAWAGDLGSIREDSFGIDTSMGVGYRVAHIAKLANVRNKARPDKLKVCFWVTRDKDSILTDCIDGIIKKLEKNFPSWIEYEVLNLTQIQLKRCLGCSVCPYYFDKPEKYGVYKDRIQNDDMKDIYVKLINTDAIIVAGFNPVNSRGIKDVYQIFVERTRQIRRDNFLLTNIPIASFSLEEAFQNNPFSEKVMISFLRHNSIILPPIKQCFIGDKTTNDPYDGFENFMKSAIQICKGRRHIKLKYEDTSYVPIGYNIGGSRINS